MAPKNQFCIHYWFSSAGNTVSSLRTRGCDWWARVRLMSNLSIPLQQIRTNFLPVCLAQASLVLPERTLVGDNDGVTFLAERGFVATRHHCLRHSLADANWEMWITFYARQAVSLRRADFDAKKLCNSNHVAELGLCGKPLAIAAGKFVEGVWERLPIPHSDSDREPGLNDADKIQLQKDRRQLLLLVYEVDGAAWYPWEHRQQQALWELDQSEEEPKEPPG